MGKAERAIRCFCLPEPGYKVPQIARIVLRSEDTVARVFHRFLTGGLDAVPRRTAPGRERRITAAWESELLRVIEIDPHARWAGDRELNHRTTRGLPEPTDRHSGDRRDRACVPPCS